MTLTVVFPFILRKYLAPQELKERPETPKGDLNDVQKALEMLGLEEGSDTQAIYTRYQELSSSSMIALSSHKKG
jgi:hypothetical protein